MNNLEFLKKYKLFIVDYDGTILDSMRMWNTTLSRFLISENIKFDVDIDDLAKKQTNHESFKYMKDNYFPNLSYEEISDKMYKFIKREYVNQRLKNNADKLLESMKKYGKVVLFSATTLDLLYDSFNTNNINKYFDYIYSASDMNTTKENGIGFNEILKLEGIDKKDALVVEDVYHAIEGAKYQGIDVLAIYDNQNHWNDIIKIADYNLNLDSLE